MNDDLSRKPPVFPRLVRAWETSDYRLFAAIETDVAQEHEAKLIAADKERQLSKVLTASRQPTGVKMNDLEALLKANPELVERLINS